MRFSHAAIWGREFDAVLPATDIVRCDQQGCMPMLKTRNLFRRWGIFLSPLDEQRLRDLGVEPDAIRAGMTDRYPPLLPVLKEE